MLHAQVAPVASSPVGVASVPTVVVPAILSQWGVSTLVEGSYGYKDNLLLSRLAEERSLFARGSVSLLLLRATTGRYDFSFFGQADGTHFFSGKTVRNEAQAWAQTEIAVRPSEGLKLAMPITGYYSDRVFDESDTEAKRLIAHIKMTGAMLGPLWRWDFRPGWWLEAQGTADRKSYDDGSNDGHVGEGALRIGWKPAERAELRLSGTRRWRDFDRRVRYTAAGRELEGTRLKIAERELELRLDVTWDAAERWQTMTRAGVRDYRDGGTGYFDFREGKIGHELEWRNGAWLMRCSGMARRIEFLVQTVGFGLVTPPRIKDEYLAELRIERKLGGAWTALAEYVWERSRSNDAMASYVVNEGLLGLRWSWEK